MFPKFWGPLPPSLTHGPDLGLPMSFYAVYKSNCQKFLAKRKAQMEKTFTERKPPPGRHLDFQSRDHSMSFPIGGPLELNIYLQPFSRYSAQRILTNEHTSAVWCPGPVFGGESDCCAGIQDGAVDAELRSDPVTTATSWCTGWIITYTVDCWGQCGHSTIVYDYYYECFACLGGTG